jgi:hypothetical protein
MMEPKQVELMGHAKWFFALGDSTYPSAADLNGKTNFRIFSYYLELAWFGISAGAELAIIALAWLSLFLFVNPVLVILGSILLSPLIRLLVMKLWPRVFGTLSWFSSLYLGGLTIFLEFVLRDIKLTEGLANLSMFPGVTFLAMAPYSAYALLQGLVFLLGDRMTHIESLSLKQFKSLLSWISQIGTVLFIAAAVVLSMAVVSSETIGFPNLGKALSITLIVFNLISKILPVKKLGFDQVISGKIGG